MASGVAAARAYRYYSAHHCECVFDAMAHLPNQNVLLLNSAFALADVPGDFRSDTPT
jgi:hypothetical protein